MSALFGGFSFSEGLYYPLKWFRRESSQPLIHVIKIIFIAQAPVEGQVDEKFSCAKIPWK